MRMSQCKLCIICTIQISTVQRSVTEWVSSPCIEKSHYRVEWQMAGTVEFLIICISVSFFCKKQNSYSNSLHSIWFSLSSFIHIYTGQFGPVLMDFRNTVFQVPDPTAKKKVSSYVIIYFIYYVHFVLAWSNFKILSLDSTFKIPTDHKV